MWPYVCAHVSLILTNPGGDLLCEHRGNHRAQEFINMPQSIYYDAEGSLPGGQASMQTRSVAVHVLLVLVKLWAVVNCCIPEETSKASRETTAA